MVVGMSGGYGAWPPQEPEPTLELRQSEPSRWEKLRGRLPASRPEGDAGATAQVDERSYGVPGSSGGPAPGGGAGGGGARGRGKRAGGAAGGGGGGGGRGGGGHRGGRPPPPRP